MVGSKGVLHFNYFDNSRICYWLILGTNLRLDEGNLFTAHDQFSCHCLYYCIKCEASTNAAGVVDHIASRSTTTQVASIQAKVMVDEKIAVIKM